MGYCSDKFPWSSVAPYAKHPRQATPFRGPLTRALPQFAMTRKLGRISRRKNANPGRGVVWASPLTCSHSCQSLRNGRKRIPFRLVSSICRRMFTTRRLPRRCPPRPAGRTSRARPRGSERRPPPPGPVNPPPKGTPGGEGGWVVGFFQGSG